ncbi:hypothetical protein [Denitromonas ohlonensis]|uniref:hypothetical protein n=1 Tax=Denitromonas ohlonensis TaxID=3078508 RepID=UPI0016424E9F|nr:hypothetical protein [Denitromonas ohlonensis]
MSRESARDALIPRGNKHPKGTMPVRTKLVRHCGALDFLGALRRNMSNAIITSD